MALWLIGLLLAAQWLALAHRIAHGPLAAPGHPDAPGHAREADHLGQAVGHLFDHHDADSAQCRLIDGAAQALATAPAMAAAAAFSPGSRWIAALAAAPRPAAPEGLPQARAPPSAPLV